LNVYFIRGYFEGDGSVNLHNRVPRVSIASNSLDILNNVKNISGIGSVYLSQSGNQWQVNSGSDAIKFLEYIYEDTSTPYLERKFNKYAQLCSWVPSILGTSVKFNTTQGLIRFSKTRADAIVPQITDIHASGIDLHLLEKIKSLDKDVDMYTTGLKVSPPEGYYFILVGRSSISKSGYSLANAIGIIDENYVGEILVALRKHTDRELTLPNRLVQLILVPKINCEFTVVDSLEDTERGTGGFGSTG
jgi:deoxyuridine 5'-triphosphate nucleotidohydrolase